MTWWFKHHNLALSYLLSIMAFEIRGILLWSNHNTYLHAWNIHGHTSYRGFHTISLLLLLLLLLVYNIVHPSLPWVFPQKRFTWMTSPMPLMPPPTAHTARTQWAAALQTASPVATRLSFFRIYTPAVWTERTLWAH